MLDNSIIRGFPQRSDLMSLSTITRSDLPPRAKEWSRTHSDALKTDDIPGAQPSLPSYRYTNKKHEQENLSLQRKRLYRPSNSLTTSDIERASPNVMSLKTRRLGTDPLNPQYNLPSFSRSPPTPPKFLRDTLNVSDITNVSRESKNPKDILDVSDINARRSPLSKPSFYSPDDITKIPDNFTRSCNPLAPVYKSVDGELVGEIEGSKPKMNYHSRERPLKSLETKDIEGAATGTVGLGMFRNIARKFIAQDKEIEGNKPGSLVKGIRTKRMTDPLSPQYSWQTDENIQVLKTVQNDKKSAKSERKENKTSSVKTPAVSERSDGRTDNLPINAQHFFGLTPKATPNTDKRAFRVSAENYFWSPNKFVLREFDWNPASIHRKKQPKPTAGEGYQKDTEAFYGATPRNEYQFVLARDDFKQPSYKSQSSEKHSDI